MTDLFRGSSSSGFHCAIMLELIRILSLSDEPLKNGIVFLFNGAKESGSQGAHGFLTSHEWAQNVKTVINLDSFGAGGKEVLFQLGDNHPSILEVYSNTVPHPHAQVLMDIVFETFLSDQTDFSTFSDTGKLPGLGFGNFHNGYVYHTASDVDVMIPLGSYQHTGDNVLALVKQIVFLEDLSESQYYTTGKPVYFDVFGMFVVSYTECTTLAVNALATVFSVVMITKHVSYLKSILGSTAQRKHLRLVVELSITGHVITLTSTTILAGLLNLSSLSLSWYTRQWLIFPLYFGLVCVGHIFTARLVEEHKRPQIPRVVSAQMSLFAAQIVTTGALLITTLLALRLSYLLLILIIFPTVAMYLMTTLGLHKKSKTFLVGYLIGLIIPTVLIIHHAEILFSALIPMYGRSVGENLSPDKSMALLVTFFGGIILSYLAPLVILVRYAGRVLTWLIAVPLFVLIAVRLTPLGFPYGADNTSPTQQRINVIHTERTFYNALDKILRYDSGLWVVPEDMNLPVTLSSLLVKQPTVAELSKDCEQEIYCGLPVYDAKRLGTLGNSYWIPSAAPVIHSPVSLELTTRKMASVTIRKLGFVARGPDHMVLMVTPLANIRLVFWSFSDLVPIPPDANRYTHIVTRGRGGEEVPWTFWLAFEIPMGNLTANAADITLVGHYMHLDRPPATSITEFKEKFPKWTHLTTWTSMYKSWVV